MVSENTDNSLTLVIFTVFILIAFALYILFLLTLWSTLKLIKPQNRIIEPAKVWLMLIPIFNMFYQFVIVFQVVQSIRFEFKARQIIINHRIILYTGNIACILNLLGFFSENMAIGGLIFSFAFWIQLLIYRNKIRHFPEEAASWDFDE